MDKKHPQYLSNRLKELRTNNIWKGYYSLIIDIKHNAEFIDNYTITEVNNKKYCCIDYKMPYDIYTESYILPVDLETKILIDLIKKTKLSKLQWRNRTAPKQSWWQKIFN